jgi:hypothetical protein
MRCPGRTIANPESLEHPLTQGSRDHDRSPFNEIRSADSNEESGVSGHHSVALVTTHARFSTITATRAM